MFSYHTFLVNHGNGQMWIEMDRCGQMSGPEIEQTVGNPFYRQ